MLFKEFGKAKTLADAYLWSIACAKAGIPCLLIAPPSGGKSTVIFAVEKWLKEHGEPTLRVSRLGLRGLRNLADLLKKNKMATLLNEDYANIGSSDYMVEKMGELVGALSYSGSYQDYGLKIDLNVDRLGFISGVQPRWIKTMMTHTVFSTFIREKFLRYYFLPFTPTKDLDDLEAQQILNENTKQFNASLAFQIPKEFMRALAFQVGQTRAQIYAPKIARELVKLIGNVAIGKAFKFYAVRLGFEQLFVNRELTDTGFSVETEWQGYHALYWALRYGRIKREDYLVRLGVSSMRSVDMCLDKAIGNGWVTSFLDSRHRIYVPNYNILRGTFFR